MATEITYHGAVIAQLADGQKATLDCAGKMARSNIEITFAGAGSITCAGGELSVGAGKRAVLVCMGKKMPANVIISAAPMTGGAVLLTGDGDILTDANGSKITTTGE